MIISSNQNYLISFGQTYFTKPHPVLWKVPDLPSLLWLVRAPDEPAARHEVVRRLGQHWAFLQPLSDLTEEDRQAYEGMFFCKWDENGLPIDVQVLTWEGFDLVMQVLPEGMKQGWGWQNR